MIYLDYTELDSQHSVIMRPEEVWLYFFHVYFVDFFGSLKKPEYKKVKKKPLAQTTSTVLCFVIA